AYKARISAHGYATLEVDLKGGDPNRSATLIAKPRVLSIDSEPSGAVILVDSGTTGHTTPFDIELTAAQAQKKSIRVQLRKSGYRALERTVDLGKLTEEDTRMITKLQEKLLPAPAITRTGGSNAGTGSAKGSDATGAGSDATAPANGSADGSAASPGPVTSPSGTPSTPPPAPTPAPSGTTSGSSGSAAEPEPNFDKPHN
ncbi:MAG: PEGA domain-containing protein, partial [bacterium]